MSATVDTLEGIRTKWDATSGITAVIPTASLYTSSVPAVNLPYCVVTVKREKAPEYQQPRTSGTAYLDWRRVTFDVYASSLTGAETAVDAILAGLNTEFAIPNATHLDWRLDGETDAAEERQPSSAADGVYKASVEFVSMQQRSVP